MHMSMLRKVNIDVDDCVIELMCARTLERRLPVGYVSIVSNSLINTV